MNLFAGHRIAGPDDLEQAVAIIRDAGFLSNASRRRPSIPTPRTLRRVIAERYDACIVAGGDGTGQPAAAALLDSEVVLGEITVDGQTHAHRAMQILVLDSPYYGWALPLLPDASMEDGKLDVAVFPRMGRIGLLRSLVSLLRTRALPQKPVRYAGARITMTCDEPISVHADGKVAATLPAEFTCRAGALKVFI